MITITGVDRGGLAYQVVVGAQAAELGEIEGFALPDSYGEAVQCTSGIAALLRLSDGEPVPLTPTGPTIALSTADPRSVVAWLQLNTGVASIDGELPPMDVASADVVPGAVY